MSPRSRVLAIGGLLTIATVLLALALRGASARADTLVICVPSGARGQAVSALAGQGHVVDGEPIWTASQPGWRMPGHYRLIFVGSRDGAADVYSVEAQVDAQGTIVHLGRATRLVDTPAGDETLLVATDGWLAYATRVGGYYQSITCVPLGNLRQQHVFAFGQPVGQARLSWHAQALARPALEVRAGELGQEAAIIIIDPTSQAVTPADADLHFLPAHQGEQAWLPHLVSRIRELPGVGPEKIAFLENVFFTVLDHLTRLMHGPVASAPVATEAPATAVPATSTAVAVDASATASSPTAAASATPAATPTATGRVLADGIIWRDTVQPDPQRPYADVEIVDIDPGLLQLKMIPGTIEPKPSTGLVGTGVIPREDWPFLVAGFNGGFAAMHGQYGLMVDRKVYLPPRDGIATVAVYEDGSLRMGTWGRDLVQTPDMVSFRQNCPPLVEQGRITAETGKLTLWGLSVANEVYLYRSGLGVTADGHLVYVAGKPLSAYTLARALQMAGAVYGMQLDVDEFHVAFFTYHLQGDVSSGEGTITAHKLRDDMRGFDGYFLRPFQLDFFYLTRRPERLAQAVRLAPAPTAPSALPVLADRQLPGRIAFASNRDGNWELYSIKPGEPASLRRLTDNVADDLYPCWSADGQKLAFTSRRDGNAEIYVLDPSSGALQRVTRQGSEEWAPAWAPDGSKLAYQSDRNGQSDIYVCAPDGSGEVRLTPLEGNHEAPHWAPDGSGFVFDSDLDVTEAVHASINLYVMAADGSNPRRLLANAEWPVYSPDGGTIAFIGRRTGFWQIYLVGKDGTGLRQLTRCAYDARYPAWSPDGRWIAFAGNQGGHWEIYAVPVGGGDPVRLTTSAADSTYPSWGP
ncbi:MAG: phosphodiester glycosidase family protein [Anaerolineae bacterium]